MSSKLFQPVQIGPLKLKNRFMRSPCHMNLCDNDGFPTSKLHKYYRDMADGQMGLIVPEYLYMSQASKADRGQGCIGTDEHAKAWQSTVDYVHKQGTKIVFQVADAGTATTAEVCGQEPRGASPQGPGTRAMTKLEISGVIEDYVKAAVRLQNVGVDGIELHAAHGYLISQFLSPAINKRDDEYGGSPENRRRLLQEIVSAIRANTDKNFAIMAKINADDCIPGGVTPEDLAETVKAIKGMDCYEISCGFQDARTIIRSLKLLRKKGYELKPKYNLEAAKLVRKVNPNVPLAVVGGIRTIKDMEDVINAGIDLVSLGRPTIADPKVVQHLMEGDKKVKCISCGKCLLADNKEHLTYCPVFNKKKFYPTL